jgi:hypothetical protein
MENTLSGTWLPGGQAAPMMVRSGLIQASKVLSKLKTMASFVLQLTVPFQFQRTSSNLIFNQHVPKSIDSTPASSA